MKRRDFLKQTLRVGGGLLCARAFPALSWGEERRIKISRTLFPQSVACADVDTDQCTLWTRVEPSQPAFSIPLRMELSADENFHKVVISSVVQAEKENDYTVRVPLVKLSPDTRYFYRFLLPEGASPTGEFRTWATDPKSVRFGFVSCNDYINGYYSAYYHLSREKLDFVLHLGDYIYETVGAKTFQYGGKRSITLNDYGYAYTLEDYRKLYKTYKADPNLQRVHEKFPFYQIWDDHEFANDAAGAYAFDSGQEFAGSDLQVKRRKAASRAFWEFVPGNFVFHPDAIDYQKQIRIYRDFKMGKLLYLTLTDERLYRDPHPCGEKRFGQRYAASCLKNMQTTMLGKEQKAWFLKGLKQAEKEEMIWKVHGNEVAMSQMLLSPSKKRKMYLNLDQWDGYAGERKEILSFLQKENIQNTIVLTGDLHTFVAGELEASFNKANAPQGVEFLTTSITSANLGHILHIKDSTMLQQIEKKVLRLNHNLRYFNSHDHGYGIIELNPEEALVEFWRVSSIQEQKVEKTEKQLVKRFRIRRGTNRMEILK